MGLKKLAVIAIVLSLCSGNKGEETKHNNCITWADDLLTVTVICRVANFTQPVTLIHDNSKSQIDCSIIKPRHFCAPREKNISVDYHQHTVVVQIVELKNEKQLDGNWHCLQGGSKLTTDVSLVDGIKSDSWVIIRGKPIKHGDGSMDILVECSSCREPEERYVEFLVNKRSYGSIWYNSKGECVHKLAVCNPSECSCSSTGNMFSLKMTVTDVVKEIACEMQFADKLRGGRFKKTARMVLSGEEIIFDDTITDIIIKNRKTSPTLATVKENVYKLDSQEQNKDDNRTSIHTSGVGLITTVTAVVIVNAITVTLVALAVVAWKKRCTKYDAKQKVDQSSKSDSSADNAGESRYQISNSSYESENAGENNDQLSIARLIPGNMNLNS